MDPDGRLAFALIPFPPLVYPFIPPTPNRNRSILGDGFYQMPSPSPYYVFPSIPKWTQRNTTVFPELRLQRQLTMLFFLLVYDHLGNVFNKAPGIDAIQESDKNLIAQHSADGGHGYEVNLNNPTKEGIKQKIDEILSDSNTKVKTRKRDGAILYMAEDGTALIYNQRAEDKGTIYVPDNPEKMYKEW